jgi:hypothetical protein
LSSASGSNATAPPSIDAAASVGPRALERLFWARIPPSAYEIDAMTTAAVRYPIR